MPKCVPTGPAEKCCTAGHNFPLFGANLMFTFLPLVYVTLKCCTAGHIFPLFGANSCLFYETSLSLLVYMALYGRQKRCQVALSIKVKYAVRFGRIREHTFMTSTQNPQKCDPPPSPIHTRPQFSKISGTPLPLNADAGVSFFMLSPPPPPQEKSQ